MLSHQTKRPSLFALVFIPCLTAFFLVSFASAETRSEDPVDEREKEESGDAEAGARSDSEEPANDGVEEEVKEGSSSVQEEDASGGVQGETEVDPDDGTKNGPTVSESGDQEVGVDDESAGDTSDDAATAIDPNSVEQAMEPQGEKASQDAEDDDHDDSKEKSRGDSDEEVDAGSSDDNEEGEGQKAKKQNVVIRYLDSVFGMPDDPTRPRFIVYPVVGFAPETSWEFGLSGLYVYYAKDNPKNRLSEVSAFGFVTLETQYGLHLDHAIYTDRDEWFFLGSGRFQSFPLLYYGIGPNTDPEYQAQVDETSLLIRERVLRKIVPSFYIGPEFAFDLLSDVQFNFRDGVDPVLPRGAEGSLNVGAGLGVVYDSRHNVLNTRDGLFSELAVLHSNEVWGSDFSFSTIQSDTRYYFPVNSRDTLAAQLFGQFTFGDVPFNELSTLGGPNLMRGYYLGRFRDRHFVGAQIEYRFLPLPFPTPFTRRFGASIFASTGTVFPGPSLPPIQDFVVAGGTGLRFLLFPEKDIYTRADLAFTAEGPAFYLFIGEAF